MEYKKIVNGIDETIMLAQNIEAEKFPNMIICLDGELGAGKTTFTKGFAHALGITDNITSPTFTIIKEYVGELPLYHMDVYRLNGSVEGIGFDEYLNKNGVVIIEWADTILNDLPSERLDIKIKVMGENKRMFIIEPHGNIYENLCEEVL